jgi:hypothetical protein
MDNLTRNAMLARKAGMTYGQWKALHPNTKDDVPKVPLKGECVCQHCGKAFVSRTKQKRKFCDFYCQNAAAQVRLKERKEKNNGKSENVRDL